MACGEWIQDRTNGDRYLWRIASNDKSFARYARRSGLQTKLHEPSAAGCDLATLIKDLKPRKKFGRADVYPYALPRPERTCRVLQNFDLGIDDLRRTQR